MVLVIAFLTNENIFRCISLVDFSKDVCAFIVQFLVLFSYGCFTAFVENERGRLGRVIHINKWYWRSTVPVRSPNP